MIRGNAVASFAMDQFFRWRRGQRRPSGQPEDKNDTNSRSRLVARWRFRRDPFHQRRERPGAGCQWPMDARRRRGADLVFALRGGVVWRDRLAEKPRFEGPCRPAGFFRHDAHRSKRLDGQGVQPGRRQDLFGQNGVERQKAEDQRLCPWRLDLQDRRLAARLIYPPCWRIFRAK